MILVYLLIGYLLIPFLIVVLIKVAIKRKCFYSFHDVNGKKEQLDTWILFSFLPVSHLVTLFLICCKVIEDIYFRNRHKFENIGGFKEKLFQFIDKNYKK